MADLTDADFDAAYRRGEIEMRTKPRARAVRYDPAREQIVVDLVNGATFSFPAGLAQGLEHATSDELAAVEVLGAGFGLHWPRLDVDHLVEALLAGRFGSRKYLIERFGADWDAAAAE